jgi:hypothetical protein
MEYKEFKTIDHLLNLKWRFYDIVGHLRLAKFSMTFLCGVLLEWT